MSLLAEQILSAAMAMPEGGLLSPKEFLHLANRSAIDKTLSRLTQEGKLMRVCRGMYVAPCYGRFGARAPSTESIVRAIEKKYGETVVPTGVTEANAFGLATQIAVREIFLTSGSSRTLLLGKRVVEFRHGTRWEIAMGSRMAGQAIRAMAWVGPEGHLKR